MTQHDEKGTGKHPHRRKNLIRTTKHPPGVPRSESTSHSNKEGGRAVALLRDLAPEEGRGVSLNPQILRSGSIATLRVTFTITPIRVRSNAGKRIGLGLYPYTSLKLLQQYW